MKELKVSIITVVYNMKETIERTINSVIQQDYKDIEYIIIDGGSTDGTQDIIKKYENHIANWVSEKDEGIYDAMNKGINCATGDIIGIINADDWYESGALREVVKKFEQTDADLIYGRVYRERCDGVRIEVNDNVDLNQLWYNVVIAHPGLFVKKNVYEQIGEYLTKFKIAADYEFMLRAYTKGCTYEYLDCAVANYSVGGASTTNILQGRAEVLQINLMYRNRCPDQEWISKKIDENRNIVERLRINHILQKNPSIIQQYLKNIDIDKDIYIWGAGIRGRKYVELLCEYLQIKGIVDNNKEIWGQEIANVPIINPNSILNNSAYVIITPKKSEEIVAQLKEYDNVDMEWITIEEITKRAVDRYGI